MLRMSGHHADYARGESTDNRGSKEKPFHEIPKAAATAAAINHCRVSMKNLVPAVGI
jgi:hypothetical protein